MGIANNGPSGLASNFSARRTPDISARTSLHAHRLSVAKLADSLAKKEAALLNAAYRGFPPTGGKTRLASNPQHIIFAITAREIATNYRRRL